MTTDGPLALYLPLFPYLQNRDDSHVLLSSAVKNQVDPMRLKVIYKSPCKDRFQVPFLLLETVSKNGEERQTVDPLPTAWQ